MDAAVDVLVALSCHREATPPLDGAYIFRPPVGTPHDPDNWTKPAPANHRAAQLEDTFASLLIDQDENPKYVSRQFGHASPAFTFTEYACYFRETSDRAMAASRGAIRTAKRRRFEVLRSIKLASREDGAAPLAPPARLLILCLAAARRAWRMSNWRS